MENELTLSFLINLQFKDINWKYEESWHYQKKVKI